jgi:hypothetical protein
MSPKNEYSDKMEEILRSLREDPENNNEGLFGC